MEARIRWIILASRGFLVPAAASAVAAASGLGSVEGLEVGFWASVGAGGAGSGSAVVPLVSGMVGVDVMWVKLE